MSDKTMRPWFRFQLQTLMLMTLTAGGFIYLNTLPGEEKPLQIRVGGTTMARNGVGWPLPFFTETYTKSLLPQGLVTSPSIRHTRWPSYLINGLTGLAVLLAVAFVSEVRLRRKESQGS